MKPSQLSCVLVAVLSCGASLSAQEVLLGIDVLHRDGYQELDGQRVGLITNHTGLNRRGETTIDLLAAAPNVTLVRLFGPEHGIRGEFDQPNIDDAIDGPTGLPVVSLYGPRRKPAAEQLADLDVLVFDIQDIGCRFYTYISTMKLAMQAAAETGVRFVVLDRPNPIDGLTVEGPLRDPGEDTFVACHPIPVRHGMTAGELARMLATESQLDVELSVVRVEGWRREQYWDQTGLLWTNPSPNMRRLNQAILYPGVGLLETTNLSVGRGTDTPFELLGAPWIDPWELQTALAQHNLPGIRFVPRFFTPDASKHRGQRCGGVDLIITDRAELRPVDVGMAIAATLRRLYPHDWDASRYPRLLVSDTVYQALLSGATAEELVEAAKSALPSFSERRARFLLY